MQSEIEVRAASLDVALAYVETLLMLSRVLADALGIKEGEHEVFEEIHRIIGEGVGSILLSVATASQS